MKAPSRSLRLATLAVAAITLATPRSHASIAYGSINNFDTVNDTGHECHGFEIEIEDCHSTDITYTFDYNHYGTSRISQDDSIPGHPKTVIRWEAKRNPDGSWSAYTAIPSAAIAPTDGHSFTNPAVNFGGEHFGVGYSAPVGAIRYHWLIDDGNGNLIQGGAVQISTPVFTYYPPVIANNPPQIQAVIEPPPPPEFEPREFGKAIWVKEIRTTSHNNREIKLRELLSDDPDRNDEKNWRNGEPDEVETEWQLLQTDYGQADGGVNGKKPAQPEELPGGDEVVTRRYEFYKYTGPIDAETGEAMADSVAPDGIHGSGVKTINGIETDLSTLEIVGEYAGAQMAAVGVADPVGLIDHVNDGEINVPYTDRRLVVEGALPAFSFIDGNLPAGMSFDEITGILSGTPTEDGEFHFTITTTDTLNPEVAKTYTLRIAAAGQALAPVSLVDTQAVPVGSGTTTGDGAYQPGDQVTLDAAPAPGYRFANWTDNGVIVSTAAHYTFTLDIHHSLIANFVPDIAQWSVTTQAQPVEGGTVSPSTLVDDGSPVTLTATPLAGYTFSNWSENGTIISTTASYTFTPTADRLLIATFVPLPTYEVITASSPTNGGSTTGTGSYLSGSSVTLTATASPGYVFSKWVSGSNTASTNSTFTFTVGSPRTLTAQFIASGQERTITSSANPSAGGTISGSGHYSTGDSATLTATANPGYTFSRWTEGNTTVSISPSYTFTVTADRTLVARFNEAFTVSTTSAPSSGGTTEMDSATYKSNETAKAKAFPAPGYTFVSWTENGTVVSTDAIYSFKINGTRSLVAHFTQPNLVLVNTTCSPADSGDLSGDGEYEANHSATVHATPRAGFRFLYWTQNGAPISVDPDYAFIANSSVTLVAHFIASVDILADSSPLLGGTVSGSGTYTSGEPVTLLASPAPGYAFTGWTENGAFASDTAAYSFSASTNRLLTATFIALPPIALNPNPTTPGLLELTWPTHSPGWILEESTDLSHWAPSQQAISTRGDQNTCTISPTSQPHYFRLRHP